MAVAAMATSASPDRTPIKRPMPAPIAAPVMAPFFAVESFGLLAQPAERLNTQAKVAKNSPRGVCEIRVVANIDVFLFGNG